MRVILALFGAALLVEASPYHDVDKQSSFHPPDGSILKAIRREVNVAALKSTHDFKKSTHMYKRWNDAVLLDLDAGSHHEIKVVCTDCYLKGLATGELSFPDDFNVTRAIDSVASRAETSVKDLTDDALGLLKNLGNEIEDVFTGDDGPSDFPTFPYDFNKVDVLPIPQANMSFTFEGLELYMLLDTTLTRGATYTLNLYNSGRETTSPLGIYITKKLQLGLIFTVDLILTAEKTTDVSAGFHLLLDDAFGMDIPLFGNNISIIKSNGGQFELLPVHVESPGATFTAALRLGAHVGVSVYSAAIPAEISKVIPSIGGGIEVGVFADVAQFITNVTVEPNNPDCKLALAESYQFAVGAAAGATMGIDRERWGPVATKLVPLFSTKLASGCAISGRAARTSTTKTEATHATESLKQHGMSTAVVTKRVTYTGVNCLSTGLVNCPASLQNTTLSMADRTLTTLVTSGANVGDITWPATTQHTVATTSVFQSNALRLPSTSGSPTTYTAPATTSTNVTNPNHNIDDKGDCE